MTTCRRSDLDSPASATHRDARDLPSLRLLDITLACTLLAALALPLALARALGRVQRQPVQGRAGTPVDRLALVLPDSLAGRMLAACGAAQWPVLLNILRGQLAFVGPRPRRPSEAVAPATLAVRPGLVNPWFVRRRTAVDFGSEVQADADYLAGRGLRHDLGLLLRGAVAAVLPPPAACVPGRVQVGDVAFDNVDMAQAIARLDEMLDGPQAQQVSFVNPACVNIAAWHRGYRRLLARVGLVLPDGIGIKIGSDWLGTPLKQNVNGTDLFPRLCDLLQTRGAGIYLLGGQPGVAEGVAAEIGRRWPGVRVCGLRDGFFSVAEEGTVAAQVLASRADLLLVARGVPSQDLFIDRYLPLMGVKVAMGVGGLFDFVSGRIPRAPLWMREIGLEWLYRLLQEPGRMWRRYLLGNFSFLGRVVLQRLGLRRPARDAEPQARTSAGAGTAGGTTVRAVIFATTRVAADLPLPTDTPAALLPLGAQTVIEQVMDRLLHASIRDVDLVVSDRPEALRTLLGDGSRWGMRLRWHLVPDPTRPYGVLKAIAQQGPGQLLIGHAESCPSGSALLRLMQTPAWAVQAEAGGGLVWNGWASAAADRLSTLACDLDIDGLARALKAGGVSPAWWADADLTRTNGAAHLLNAAAVAGEAQGQADIPAAWVPTAWGAMSPLARVHPQARITGPVRIGPGCIVDRDAEVGPAVVLSRDVVVSRGTRITHSVILPGSYIGTGLELRHAVVNGGRLRHVALGVETALPATDALLLDLSTDLRPVRLGLPRLAAIAASLLAAPALAAHDLLRRLAGCPTDWQRLPVVTGRDESTGALRVAELHGARTDTGTGGSRFWAHLAGLRDVAAGRCRWIGVRPRDRGQWYALRPEWQQILSRSQVGLLHARAWTDDPSLREEARAAADVYLAVQPPLKRLWVVLRGWLQPAALEAR